MLSARAVGRDLTRWKIDGAHYIAVEFVDGVTLRILHRTGRCFIIERSRGRGGARLAVNDCFRD
jgi:hypothetical protein